jgi:hypothetical protein
MRLSSTLFLLSGIVVCLSLQNETELHIGTLIPLLAVDYFGYKNAFELAAETIHSQGLLKGYKLVFHHKDTLVSIYCILKNKSLPSLLNPSLISPPPISSLPQKCLKKCSRGSIVYCILKNIAPSLSFKTLSDKSFLQ